MDQTSLGSSFSIAPDEPVSHEASTSEQPMRSDHVYRALEHGHSRFEICQLVSKSVKRLHKPGSRFQDTINHTLLHMMPAEVPVTPLTKSAPPLAKAA
jgi:hypothetical protein